jgi:hypothetical protein
VIIEVKVDSDVNLLIIHTLRFKACIEVYCCSILSARFKCFFLLQLKISFVDEGPEIYEYPSESSLLVEDVSIAPPAAQIRNSVPSLSGKALRNIGCVVCKM